MPRHNEAPDTWSRVSWVLIGMAAAYFAYHVAMWALRGWATQ